MVYEAIAGEGHPNDICWINATVCWDKSRDCWVFPGGGITRIESKAVEMARRINAMISDKKEFKRALAA